MPVFGGVTNSGDGNRACSEINTSSVPGAVYDLTSALVFDTKTRLVAGWT